MNSTARKMSKIIDELVCFFSSIGSTGMKMDLQKETEGYRLFLESDYTPEHRKEVNDLDKFLNITEKNEGLEEFFWQLAGVSSLGQDSELHLVGQMIDNVKIEIGEQYVKLELYKKLDN